MSHYCRITAPPELSWPVRDRLYQLFSSCFDNTSRDRFERDLDSRDWVVLVEDDHRVVGFTTAQLVHVESGDEELRFLYSGDTLVAPEHWGRPMLPAAFGHLMLDLVARSHLPLYWLLVSKGFRTYRLLAANFVDYVPDCRRPTDGRLGRHLNVVARELFGERFDAATGVVRAGLQTEHLKPELQDFPPGRRQNPHISYFLDRNPGWRRGDELVCLAPCDRSNLTRLAHRQLASVEPVWECR